MKSSVHKDLLGRLYTFSALKEQTAFSLRPYALFLNGTYTDSSPRYSVDAALRMLLDDKAVM
jgi:hypothetical protein